MSKNCEHCFAPYMDDRKKIIFQGMEFCDINCFIKSKYFEDENVKMIQDIQSKFDKEINDLEKEKDSIEKIAKTTLESLDNLLTKWDDEFESGNKDLDKILLEITKIREDGDI